MRRPPDSARKTSIAKPNSNRLQRQIADLALISESPAPIVTRVLFSEADLRGRAFVKKICEELELSLTEDAVGNIFARWIGKTPAPPSIATGSHIDAIPNAGAYDGVVGVLGGLEAIRCLKESGFQPQRSIELIVFTAEEPTRFGIGCLGSRMLAGTLSAERLGSLRDAEGRTLEQWRSKVGLKGSLTDVALPRNRFAAFVELHIEQGTLLEREKIAIGVVEKIAAPSTLVAELIGVGGHAGAVLMPGRQDALLAGAEIALAVEQAAVESGSDDTVGTTGVFKIEPGAVNSIPCRARLEIDLRDTEVVTRDKALARIEAAIKEICVRRKIEFKLQRLNVDAPAICDASIVQTIESAASELGLGHRKMISRAYHDTLFMSLLSPTSMIFIPCRGGVSHRPDEFSSPEQIEAGVAVLARTLAYLSDRA